FYFHLHDTQSTKIYPLSLHDALPILKLSKRKKNTFKPVQTASPVTKDHKKKLLYKADTGESVIFSNGNAWYINQVGNTEHYKARSEEHTSELQSRENLVCRLLLEKKK